MKWFKRKKKYYQCSCCGYFTLQEKPIGSYEICPVCFWEQCDLQEIDPDYVGGPNTISLNQAKENFRLFGACEQQFRSMVAKPTDEDLHP